MSGPLEALRVIDCSRGTAGTRASGILADLGADVIWVEPPGGDPFREACAIPYSVFNRGKRSIVLDLRSDAARARLFELLGTADVFIESWRPGVADRLGVGYASLHARFPRLVFASISGFGTDGPERDLAGYEALVQARVGVMGEQVGHRSGPIYEALPFASIGAAYLALIGVLAALYRLNEDGVGRRVETSLLDGALAYLSMMWGDRDDADVRPVLGVGAGRLIARTFRCQDDEYLGVHTAAVGGFSRAMKVIGVDDRIPPSPTGVDVGVRLTPEQIAIVTEEIPRIFASKPRAYWLERLLAADVCAIPELRPCGVFDEPQARHNRMVALLDDPVLGRVEQVAPPARFPAFPDPVLRPAPRAGQHTDELLAEARALPARARGTAGRADLRPLLEGVKILDLGAFYAGPYSSRLLADLGADVIKLETTAGDPLRGIERPYRSAQAGKRALAVDLKDPALAPALAGLLAWADVVHHNMRPGAAERLGVGYEQVRAVNPRAVYLYAPGWGSTGPDARRQSFAPLLSGYAGVGYEVAGQFNPPLFPLGNEDPGNGLLGAVVALVALLHRQRTGLGQYVENPQLNATMAHMAHVVRRPDGTVLGAGRLDPLQRGTGALDRLYQTADGWICVVATGVRHREALGKLAGVDVTGLEFDALESLFAARPTARWLRDLAEAGVPAAEPLPYNMAAFLRDARNRERGRSAELPHPTQGHVRELAVLVRVSDAAVPPHRLAPELGQHTDEILGWLGYSAAQIAELRARRAAR
jgi:crotonobetainyl-CoA:carnitine CoA-transferase CaiB-like acyl-CoA transferase